MEHERLKRLVYKSDQIEGSIHVEIQLKDPVEFLVDGFNKIIDENFNPEQRERLMEILGDDTSNDGGDELLKRLLEGDSNEREKRRKVLSL